MAAKKGNKYAKGNKGGGRKGYTYEQTQLEKMRRYLDKYFLLSEKIFDGIASDRQKESFRLLSAMVLKIMDKLHANKQHVESEVSSEMPFHFIIQSPEEAMKRIEEKKEREKQAEQKI